MKLLLMLLSLIAIVVAVDAVFVVDDPKINKVVFSFFWSYVYGSRLVKQELRCCGNSKNGLIGFNNLPYLEEADMDRFDQRLIDLFRQLKGAGSDIWLARLS